MGLLRITSIKKPKGWTSFDVVRFVKHYFQEKKVGHLGTLDPMATGVLPVFLGRATRLIPLFNNLDKTYRAICKLGVSTDTFDAEGLVTKTNDTCHLKPNDVKNAIFSFKGKQEQLTPSFSASKINGVPAYKLARKGLKVPQKFRNVIFYELIVESIKMPFVQFRVKCSKGTYIRTLANDIGLLLEVGAHLTYLKRLACGNDFFLDNSISVGELKKIENDTNVPWISPIALLSHLSTFFATASMVNSIKYGRRIEVDKNANNFRNPLTYAENAFSEKLNQTQVKVLDYDQNLVAIGYIIWENDLYFLQPSKVFI